MKIKMISLIILAAVNSSMFAQHSLSVEVTGVEPGKGYVFLDCMIKRKVFLIMRHKLPLQK